MRVVAARRNPSVSGLKAFAATLAVRNQAADLDDVVVDYVNTRLLLRRRSTGQLLVDVSFDELDQEAPILEQLRDLVQSVMCSSCKVMLLDGEEGLCIPCEATAVKAILAAMVDLQETPLAE